MGSRKRQLLVASVLGTIGALSMSTGSSAEGPIIESAGPGTAGFFWSPSAATIGIGGSVTLRSTSTVVPHGVRWTGGPEAPSCTGVPVDQEKIGWSGDCTFAQPGAYTFVCTVHPEEMKGTITVSSSGTPPVSPEPPGGSPESPLQGPASRALKLVKSQQGTSVRGSVALSPASSGGKLEVVLLAKGSLMSAGSSAPTRIGRLVRTRVKAGRVSFAVPLTSRAARSALRSRKKLPLTVQMTVKAPGQPALTLTRGVVLHV